MRARVPLDVDLEDKLVYGLTPMRLAYLIGGVVVAFGAWTSDWAPAVVRGPIAALLCMVGGVAAWGRWHGRALDRWAIDVALFVVRNHRVAWLSTRKRPPTLLRDEVGKDFEVVPVEKAA